MEYMSQEGYDELVAELLNTWLTYSCQPFRGGYS